MEKLMMKPLVIHTPGHQWTIALKEDKPSLANLLLKIHGSFP